ncbi:MAG: hypothetical protein H7066_21680 [Cytophagaceae bacterium]|nr:hypothetical protein [Gemmatimonadaceae bacterium]
MDGGLSIEVLGYSLGNFSTPALAMASAFLIGVLLAVVPAGAAEVFALAAGGLQPRALVIPAVLLMTLGHVLGKWAWYWLGTQEGRVRHPRARRLLDDSKAVVARYPNLGVMVLASSALVSLPPFHLIAVAAGLTRYPVLLFLLVAFAGRLVRFGAIAMIPGLFTPDR